MTEVFINDVIRIQENEIKEFSDCNIYFNEKVSCRGKLIFNNCNIYYGQQKGSYEISVHKGAEITIKNSCFYCKGAYRKYAYLIRGNYADSVEIEDCSFYDCRNFIGIKNLGKLTINNATVKNCYINFININMQPEGNAEISDCTVMEEKIADFNISENDYSSYIITIGRKDNKSTLLNNLTFIEKKDEKLNSLLSGKYYLNIKNGELVNSVFIGAENCIADMNKIQSCNFEKCTSIADLHLMDSDVSRIENSKFYSCTDALKLFQDSVVHKCKFIGCSDNFIETSCLGGVTIEDCEFINLKVNTDNIACIDFKRDDSWDSKESRIKDCLFRDCELNNGYLISTSVLNLENNPAVKIEGCKFINNVTNAADGGLIKTDNSYMDFVEKTIEMNPIKIENCIKRTHPANI